MHHCLVTNYTCMTGVGQVSSRRCVNASVTVSTAPAMPAAPPPPSHIHDYRNGSLLVGLRSTDVAVYRRRRDADVVSSRLIVVEYADEDEAAAPPALSRLAVRGLTDTFDRRAANTYIYTHTSV